MTCRPAQRCIATLLVSLTCSPSMAAPASPPETTRDKDSPALFALVLGVNRSVDAELKPLKYADDDGARYVELFRMLGARTLLLSRVDENTRRVHPQAAAEAQPPRAAALAEAVKVLAAEVKQAKARKVSTLLYLAFAGHGGVKDGQGYISLEDRRLGGREIARQILAPIAAEESHLIVDACNSYLLAFGRGPGGERRPISGFSQLAGVLMEDDVGMLLSTSSAQESHEWEALQAGVFSHAVRSALLGAADADLDGRVSYRETAAFVQRASAAIPNERFRSRVFARPPRYSHVLVDLRRRADRRLQVGPALHGRYLLEDGRGVRVADFHSAEGQPVGLLRPPAGALYLRQLSRQGEDREFALPGSEGPVSLASLAPASPRSAARGAAHQAFSLLFEQPFDATVVEGYRFPRPPKPVRVARSPATQPGPVADEPSPRLQPHDSPLAAPADASRPWTPRRVAAWSTLGLSLVALGTGVGLSVSAAQLRADAPDDESHEDRVKRNDDIQQRNVAAVTLYSVAGAAAVTGALLFFLPARTLPAHTPPRRAVASFSFSAGGGQVAMGGDF